MAIGVSTSTDGGCWSGVCNQLQKGEWTWSRRSVFSVRLVHWLGAPAQPARASGSCAPRAGHRMKQAPRAVVGLRPKRPKRRRAGSGRSGRLDHPSSDRQTVAAAESGRSGAMAAPTTSHAHPLTTPYRQRRSWRWTLTQTTTCDANRAPAASYASRPELCCIISWSRATSWAGILRAGLIIQLSVNDWVSRS